MSDAWFGFEVGDYLYDLHLFTDEEGEEVLIVYPVIPKKVNIGGNIAIRGETDTSRVVLKVDLTHLSKGEHTTVPRLR